MADITSALSTMGSNFKTTLGATGTYVMYAFIIIFFMFLFILLFYLHMRKKTYNFDVVVLRPRGGTNVFDYEAGYIGKHFIDRTKESRFEIYNAKKIGIKYNNEAIEQKFIIKRFRAGKYNPLVFMTPNAQGWLQPTQLSIETGKSILAKVEDADISYYQTELELMDAMFNKKTFFEKYYLIILIFLMIIVVLIQWYAASQIHKASVNNLQAAQAMADAMKYVGDKLGGNATSNNIIPLHG